MQIHFHVKPVHPPNLTPRVLPREDWTHPPDGLVVGGWNSGLARRRGGESDRNPPAAFASSASIQPIAELEEQSTQLEDLDQTT